MTESNVITESVDNITNFCQLHLYKSYDVIQSGQDFAIL